MDYSTDSISNSISKISVDEDMSLSQAAFEDAEGRTGSVKKEPAISSETIRRGEEILNTYVVRSDAIPGGMGSVWKVYHESWNVDLAMKRPLPRYFAEAGSQRKRKFIAECEHWINLGLHPNIVSCYYVREIGGVPTIFSEWMNGGSLKDRIKDGSLYEGTGKEVQLRILDAAIQAARGIRYSHENHLIHKDVKPGNLLLTKFWEVKVADFGLAKAQSILDSEASGADAGSSMSSGPAADAGSSAGAAPSKTARIVEGTLRYCPQEQAEGEEAQEWMDVYALAVTVLEMYTGERLWDSGAEVKNHCEEYFDQAKIPIPDSVRELIRSCVTEKISDLKGVEDALIEEYRLQAVKGDSEGGDSSQSASEAGGYSRPAPEKVMDTADSLNNRALSFMDLGKPDIAESIWNKVLETSPDHVYSVYNNLIQRWYRGKIDDLEVLDRLQGLDGNKRSKDSREVLQAALKCRGEDKAIKEIGIDPENRGDWPPEMKAVRRKRPVCMDRGVLETEGSEKRFYDDSADRMIQVTSTQLRVWDLSGGQCVRVIGPVSGGEKISFVHYEEEEHTVLLGSTVWFKEFDRSRNEPNVWNRSRGRIDVFFNDPKVKTGILRLFDLNNGRCIRTLQPGVSMEFPVDENTAGHCFGSAVMNAATQEYCYPDESFTCLKYRHADMNAVPASYFVSHIQDYEQVKKWHEAINSYIETAKEELQRHHIREAYSAVDKAYAMLGDGKNEELSRLNSELGRVGRICGIRGFRTEPAEDPLPDLVNFREKRDYTAAKYSNNTDLIVNNWHTYHITEEGYRKNPILRMKDPRTGKEVDVLRLSGEFFVEQDVVVSPDLSMLYLRGKLHGEIDYCLYAVDAVTGQILSDGEPVSKDSRISGVSPDGKKLILVEHDRLFVYNIGRDWYGKVFFEEDRAEFYAGYHKEISNVCFRPDSRAVYVRAEGEPVCMFSLMTGAQYSFYEDELISANPSVFRSLWSLRAPDKDSFVCLSATDGNYRFVIDYRYEFPGWTDWDEEARPYLERYLFFHPQWRNEELYSLIEELQMRGLGYIHPDCIRSKLEEIDERCAEEFARRRKGKLPGMLLQLGEVM